MQASTDSTDALNLERLLSCHSAQTFENAHILVDGYSLILRQWAKAESKVQSLVEPNKIYLQEVRSQIERLLALRPKSLTFYLDTVVTKTHFKERIERKQKLLSTIDFDGLISPRLLTLGEIIKYYPAVSVALCDMETEHIILNDINDRVSSPDSNKDAVFLIMTETLMMCEYDVLNPSKIYFVPVNQDQSQWTKQFFAYGYSDLQAALLRGSTPRFLPQALGHTLRNPTEVACRRIEFENSIIHNNCPTILLPVIPFVEGISPYDVGSVYRRCAYSSFLNELGLPNDIPVSIYFQQSRQYKATPLCPLDRSICKAHAKYWSQRRRGTEICDELIGFISPPVLVSVGKYLNDLMAGKQMRVFEPTLESKKAVSYLSALFYSLCVLGECEFKFSTEPYLKLLTEINPSHLASYLI